MKTAIVSDTHDEYQRLRAAMQKAKDLGAERLFHLGDIIHKGGNYNGERCISLLNPYLDSHDMVFSPEQIFAIRGNKEPFQNPEKYPKISPRNFTFLQRAGTEKFFEKEGVLMIHHFPGNDSRIITGKDVKKAYKMLIKDYTNLAMCFFGHTHVPTVFENFKEQDISGKIQLKNDKIYFVNPGSLWTKDKTETGFEPRFAMYDDLEKTIEFYNL